MGLADWFSTFCTNIEVQDGCTITSRLQDNHSSATCSTFLEYRVIQLRTVSMWGAMVSKTRAIQGFSDHDMIS